MLVLFDVTSRASFESLNDWLGEAARYGISSDTTTIAIVGNKTDLCRKVTENEATAFAAMQNATYWETSAKTGVGVDDLFEFMITDACKRGFYR